MEQILNTLKNLQGQVISAELLQQLQAGMPVSQHVSYSDDKPLVIDGETEMDDLLVAQKVALMETAAMQTEWAPVVRPIRREGLDPLADEIFSDSDVEIETPAVTPARSALDQLLAQNGLKEVDRESSIGDDELTPIDIDFGNIPSTLPLYEPLIPVGVIYSQVEGMLVVKGYQVAMDERSVVCFEDSHDRKVVGIVLETFGAVQTPSYLVAVSNKESVESRGANLIGSRLCTVPSQSKLILLDEENGVFSIAGQGRDDQIEWGGDCSDDEPAAIPALPAFKWG